MKNLSEIVRLCDKPWIQEGWKPKEGDRVAYREHPKITPGMIFLTMGIVKERYIWLPLGYNPETGNYQLDDLLMEAGGFEEAQSASGMLPWKYRDHKKYPNPIIAKLTWLNELLEGKEK